MLGEGNHARKRETKTNHLSLASSEKREELFQEENTDINFFFLKLTLYKSRRFGKQNVMRKLTETKEMEIADKKRKY